MVRRTIEPTLERDGFSKNLVAEQNQNYFGGTYMKSSLSLMRMLAVAGAIAASAQYVSAQQPIQLTGASCTTPPFLHCPDKDCPADRVINPGPVVEMKTRRTYFLDYPCDLKPGEKVTFILSLHGFGSYGNWQRHYFPIMDFKDKYRLVIATPNSPTRAWSAADDEYLQNIVNAVVEQIGKENIKAFWLVGHSQGGMTSNRIVRTDFFRDRVDGWLSLSGGRLGGNPGRAATFGPPRAAAPGAAPAAPGAAAAGGSRPVTPPEISAAMAALREPPAADFSFIYETGQREMDDKGLPAGSTWAEKYSCGARRKPEEIVDAKAGYVYDGTRQNPPNPAWGLLPAAGKAEVHVYPDCKDGRVVADLVRVNKGHTEGLEPNVTEELVKLMLSAKGGKIQQLR
ncbi:MAG TPA: alpha/beta hydrolase [Blastocatellia bacterium]|nr:alpha/beta hydrolase [Blastocatellia bacterium]